MSLQDRLDAFRKNFEAGGPPGNAPEWVHEPMHRATADLIASGAADRGAKVGAAVAPQQHRLEHVRQQPCTPEPEAQGDGFPAHLMPDIPIPRRPGPMSCVSIFGTAWRR
jgi:hypothetical protein